MPDPLISTTDMAAAQERIARMGENAALQRLHMEEPDLYYEISSLASRSLSDFESVTERMESLCYRRVWFAALIAMESYRLAYHRLWQDTELGRVLEVRDPIIVQPTPPNPEVEARRRRRPDQDTEYV